MTARGGPWPAVKRVIDAVAAALALVILAPLLAAVAAWIRVDSRGPVFFRQVRLGQEMNPFEVVKFRTMQVGAPDDLHRQYIAELASGAADDHELKKLTQDPRVTRAGRFLRKTSLDELPQLVNVARGEMSLVGPRPALEYELEHYEPHHHERFAVKPGITGLWQVSGRNQLGFREMLELDVEYARTGGPLMDLKILLKTPVAAVSGAA